MSRAVDRIDKVTDKAGEEKMKKLLITLLLIFAIGCKSEAVEEVPVKELTDEEIEKLF